MSWESLSVLLTRMVTRLLELNGPKGLKDSSSVKEASQVNHMMLNR